MSSNPESFARQVLDAFDAAGHATDEEVGDAGGPSTTTLAKFRKVANGEMTMNEPRSDVLRRIDRAAGWSSGSARMLWRQGKTPKPPNEGRLKALGGKPGRHVHVDGMEGYVAWLGERLTEVEERLDLLMATAREGGDGDGDSAPTSRSLAAAADDSGDIDPEQEAPQEP